MATYKQESHLRSLLKGASWRIIAISDTILIVLLITCLTGKCSIDNAIKIGLFEFFIKYAIYYFHERYWQKYLRRGATVIRLTLYKTISWRIIATVLTFIISGSILNSFNEVALYIAFTELFTKFVLYYFHELMWLKLPLGRIRNFFHHKN